MQTVNGRSPDMRSKSARRWWLDPPPVVLAPTARGLLVGLVLLVYGRRLYWLFVAGIGFLTGLALGPRLLVGQPEWMILLVALVLALIGALLAAVAQKFVVGLIGFLAGGGSGVLLLRALNMESNALAWIVYLLLGIGGLVLGLV